jgi:hypothetical protein
MHYECRNGNYQYPNQKCPKFARVVRKKTVDKRGSTECERCFAEMKTYGPPSKHYLLKELRRPKIQNARAKQQRRKRSGIKNQRSKLRVSKIF